MKTKFLSTTAKKAKRGRTRAGKTKANEPLPKLPKKPPLILNVGKLLKKKPVKKRGRPVGSKNKSTGRKAPPGGFKSSEFVDPKDDEDTPKKRGRGRPKGAKNKAKKDDMSDISAGLDAGLAKRGRGRPKGAKNKAKVRGDTTNPNAPSFKSFMAKKKEGITHSKFKGEASDADVAKYSTAPAKKARKVRSDKGVKRGKRTKVI